MRSRALSEHVRDQNQADRDWRRAEAERIRQAEAIVPDITPSHAEIIEGFKARQSQWASQPRHVEGAPFRVRYRQFTDKWEQVRHFATAEDRAAYIQRIKGGAEVLNVWDAA
jgi:hypothetical protein